MAVQIAESNAKASELIKKDNDEKTSVIGFSIPNEEEEIFYEDE